MDDIMLYKPFNKYILRTPTFPLSFVCELTSGDEIREAELKHIFADPLVQEAVFIASQPLYHEMEKWLQDDTAKDRKGKRKNEKLKESLLRYLFRMSTRCTPFGMFAGFSAGSFSDISKIELKSKIDCVCHTRLDMNYLCALAFDLSKNRDIRKHLKFSPNSSIYKIGNQIRYVEYYYVNSHRKHHIVAVDNSEYITAVLQKAIKGERIDNLSEILVDEEISMNDAVSFVNEMIDEQLLISELEPRVTGADFLVQIIEILSRMPQDSGISTVLKNLVQIYKELNQLKQLPPFPRVSSRVA